MAIAPELRAAIHNKFSRYTLEQCLFAKADIADTLQYHAGTDYEAKLWCEIDECNARIQELQKVKSKRRLSNAEIRELLIALNNDCDSVSKHDYGLPVFQDGEKLLVATVRKWFSKLPE